MRIETLNFDTSLTTIEAFTTLRGEVDASDAYSEVNLCHYTGDSIEHVVDCRCRFCRQLGIEPERLVMPRQTHTANVAVIDEAFFSLDSAEKESFLCNIDALVTTLPGVAIGVNTADCVPIVLADPVSGIIAAAHAGWKGTVKRIAAATVAAMVERGAVLDDIHATIGASICQDCFEVGDEVVQQFAESGFDIAQIAYRNASTAKAHISLQEANSIVLRQSGIAASHITISGNCTRCQPERYFSARRLGIASGRTFTCIIRRK
ncbi:MAG: peptidoglycan editing factor PgeF [Muribaculaceae bacterium]